ncbi:MULTISPECIES: hypothetical protein [Aphanizomenonaceae]|jgi:hypothetical protein|uniref:Uncharacterized protein n=1 Tax=Dolichospermum heterosporum TAC447 TaxID=747523 RepID=A0ABY5LS44_9CYAN|nr:MULTISPECIES: hypothetical protein [Aphanizomenonaceae]MBE9257230.1 hypothetical protein [Dolichospermum sp. LEGE 00246]MDK2408546.1 hypothetical protein [Aphanizomenon sp. 202]MDK2458149.1 hypothetical protein [Aphanizomenon sp. PH219]UUO13562.1 hypothetical protein NG743_15920 [Dolichospermum heterosporum TAC447]
MNRKQKVNYLQNNHLFLIPFLVRSPEQQKQLVVLRWALAVQRTIPG